MSQDLEYNNGSGASGSAIQVDVSVDGIDDVLGASLVDAIVLSLSWTPQFDASFCEGYVVDPDGTQHTLFSYGQLPSGTSPRVDSITLTSGSYPTSGDGAWEFYLNDSYGGSNSVSDAEVKFEVTDTLMPATYGETCWWNGKAYPAGIDLTNNQRHAYPIDGAAMVNDSAHGGVKAFEFDGVDDVYRDSINNAYNNLATMSWSCWLKPGSTTTSGKQMIFCNHGMNKGNWQVAQVQTEVTVFIGYYDPSVSTSPRLQFTSSGLGLSTGTWYQLSAVFDGSEPIGDRVKLYVDDVAVTTTYTSASGGVTAIPSDTVVGPGPRQTMGAVAETTTGGSLTGSVYYPYNGRIDDCRAFPSYKLTAEDRTWLASGRGVAGGPPDFRAFYLQNQSPLGTV